MATTFRFGSPQRWEILTSDGRTIPVDPRNADYAALIASGTPIAAHDADPLSCVEAEEVITRNQLFKGLALHGVLATQDVLAAIGAGVLPPAIEAIVAAMPEADGIAARSALAGGLARDSLTFAAICAALGIAPADLDVVWAVAIAIENGGTS